MKTAQTAVMAAEKKSGQKPREQPFSNPLSRLALSDSPETA